MISKRARPGLARTASRDATISTRHQARVSGFGSSHDSTSSVCAMRLMLAENTSSHQPKGRLTEAPCCETVNTSNQKKVAFWGVDKALQSLSVAPPLQLLPSLSRRSSHAQSAATTSRNSMLHA